MEMIWPFLAFVCVIIVICCVLSIWVGGPEPEDWPHPWEPVPEERSDPKLWLHQTEAPGLTHTDDHRP